MKNDQPRGRSGHGRWLWLLMLCGVLVVCGGWPGAQSVAAEDAGPFSFMVAADMRMFTGAGTYDSCAYFRGAVEAMAVVGPGEFLITPGDVDPVNSLRWTLDQVLGSDYPWYPVVGNHELPGYGREQYPGENIDLLRAYDYTPYGTITRWGPVGCPKTTYAFDYGNAHFVMLNIYCDLAGDTATYGDIPNHLYNWLATDLSETDQPFIFVFGHEPAYPQPDVDSGRARYIGEGLANYPANRDRFWKLLQGTGVTAYICGHTHNHSALRIDDVWQIDVGHARGAGDMGAPSTFLHVTVMDDVVHFDVYRAPSDNLCVYPLRYHWATTPYVVTEVTRALMPRHGIIAVAFVGLLAAVCLVYLWSYR